MGSYPLILVASAATKGLYPDFITPDRTIPVPFVINEPNCIFRQIFEQYLRDKCITLDHTIELWSIPTIKNLVKNDVGISFLPAFTVQEELENGELARIPVSICGRSITAVCAHHKNKWISPLMQLFMDLCMTLSWNGRRSGSRRRPVPRFQKKEVQAVAFFGALPYNINLMWAR